MTLFFLTKYLQSKSGSPAEYVMKPSFWLRVMTKRVNWVQKWEINALRKKRLEAKLLSKQIPKEREKLNGILQNKANFKWLDRITRMVKIIKEGSAKEIRKPLISYLDADPDSQFEKDFKPRTSFFQVDLETMKHLDHLTEIAIHHNSYLKISKYFLN